MPDLNNLILEHQHHDQWCWAAVTEAVCRFFGSNASTQEAIVCQVLANPLCDSAPVPDACDIPFPVEFALDAMGHPNDEVGVLSFDDVKQQIDALAHPRSEEHTSELQSLRHLVCRLLLEKKT